MKQKTAKEFVLSKYPDMRVRKSINDSRSFYDYSIFFPNTKIMRTSEEQAWQEAKEYILSQEKKTTMKTGIELIAQERKEQIEKHGRTIAKDVDFNYNKELSWMAEMLLATEHEEGIDPEIYPDGWDKDICSYMLSKSYKERLIIAGALIAAELDRLMIIEPQKQ